MIELHTKTNSHMCKSQAKYHSDFENSVRETPTYSFGSSISVGNPPSLTNQEKAAADTSQTLNELQSQAEGPSINYTYVKKWQ